jgi:hypothetical protein
VPVTVGALIVAPEDNEGTGYIERYINDVAQPNIVTWTPGSTYSRTSLDHHCIMLQSGLNQSLVVRSVQVWTASPAGGGTDGRGLLKRR